MPTETKSDHVRRSRKKAERPECFRHKVTTGKSLFVLSEVDGRSAIARRFRDLIEVWSENLGGMEHLSEAQRQLVRRAASISLQSEVVEAEMAMGRTFDIMQYLALSNGLTRICTVLGLQIVPKPAKDITLTDYLREKAVDGDAA